MIKRRRLFKIVYALRKSRKVFRPPVHNPPARRDNRGLGFFRANRRSYRTSPRGRRSHPLRPFPYASSQEKDNRELPDKQDRHNADGRGGNPRSGAAEVFSEISVQPD